LAASSPDAAPSLIQTRPPLLRENLPEVHLKAQSVHPTHLQGHLMEWVDLLVAKVA
jgi:hypothetical protein